MAVDPKTNELSNATKGRSVDISPDGQFVAVGFRDGFFRIYNHQLKMVAKKKGTNRDRWVQDLKFSPNGQLLAVSSHDGKIDVYKLPDLKRVVVFDKSSSAITQLDWSLDSSAIKSNDTSYEILYYSLGSGKQDPSGASNFSWWL